MGKTRNVTLIFASLAIVLVLISLSSAILVKEVQVDSLSPGSQGGVRITLENNLNDDITNVAVNLDLTALPFSSVGSTSDSVDRINQDDKENFGFTLKSNSDIKPGDYQIPFIITFTDSNNTPQTQKGSFGVTVSGNPVLSFSASVDTPIVGRKATITFKIVNQGLADAKFVTVKSLSGSADFTLLSSEDAYIGTISSDDFQTATYNVIFTRQDPIFSALVEYTDFNNVKQTKTVNIPLTVYSQDQAIKLGIIQPNYTLYYIFVIVLIIVAWFVWRAIKKRQRMKRSMQAQERRN